MKVETKKILSRDIDVTATCVRVPVFFGHGESLNIEFTCPMSEDRASEILKNAPGVAVHDIRADAGYATQIDVINSDDVMVSRIRNDSTCDNSLNMWCVAHNLRKGAALNAVQILDLLVREGLC